jgi:hypothetical protein
MVRIGLNLSQPASCQFSLGMKLRVLHDDLIHLPRMFETLSHAVAGRAGIIAEVTLSIIGELAPLLSVLGHEMHKHHKSVTRFLARLGCCAVFVSFCVPCCPPSSLLHPLNLPSILSDYVCLPMYI